VLDSESSDTTRDIAAQAGAKVTVQPFKGYASQRNIGLKLPFSNGWVLILDADERIPTALAQEMQSFVAQAVPEVAAARMRRRDIWWGRWLRHAQISPFYVRLVRVGRAVYEREINEVLVVDGAIHDLVNAFDHYPFSKGLDHWVTKHNVYSRMEADFIASGKVIAPSWRTALFGADFNERRLHQKALFYRMPARPVIKFLYMMIGRRAFLDGVAGLRYSVLQAIYEYLIVLKVKEIEHASATRTTE
jgi:glycosyltransferase involved in cell wall biosynthesis